ncbi:MAG: hypothetical protein NC453_27540, partial [Muribaculum sp.]|nr:hypothetical protein [Muribaculum sp.]
MGFWNFIGGFALFNAVCDMFSGKPKRNYAPPQQQHYHDYDYEDYLAHGDDGADIDDLQEKVDELQLRLDDADVMSDRYDEIQDRIDELQDRIDTLEEMDDLRDELEDLQDELDDLELDCGPY